MTDVKSYDTVSFYGLILTNVLCKVAGNTTFMKQPVRKSNSIK